MAALIVAGLTSLALAEPATVLVMGIAGMCLVPSIVLARLVRRWRAARRVDGALDWLRKSVGSRVPVLRRVK